MVAWVLLYVWWQDTQFLHILHESLDFFNIPTEEQANYFLVDTKTSTYAAITDCFAVVFHLFLLIQKTSCFVYSLCCRLQQSNYASLKSSIILYSFIKLTYLLTLSSRN